MKALSIRQPWAHAVLHLGKRVENRDWSGCSYRGPVLLHASKTLMVSDFDADVVSVIHALGLDPPADLATWATRRGVARWRPAPTLPLGGIVGRAQIVDVIGNCHRGLDPAADHGPWYAGGFALVLADVEPLPFIQWRGSLGLFDVPEGAVHKALLDATREAEKLPPDHPERVRLAQMLGAW